MHQEIWRFILGALVLSPTIAAAETYIAKPLHHSDIGSVGIVHVAGGGFLLSSVDRSILVDGIWGESSEPGLPDEHWQNMLEGIEPFDKVTALLVSTPSPRHMNAQLMVEFLSANPSSHLRSVPPVILEINQCRKISEFQGRVAAILPEPGQIIRTRVGLATVEFFQFPHHNPEDYPLHLGHIVHLAGHQILHLGSAAVDAEAFLKLKLAERSYDAALLPYWFADSPSGLRFVKDHLNTEVIILTNIPVEELKTRRKYEALEGVPEFFVPKKPLDGGRF